MPAQKMGVSKRRKLDHDGSEDEAGARVTSKKAQKAFFSNAASWNLEDDYEDRQRKRKSKAGEKDVSKMPTKTFDGRIEALQRQRDDDAASVNSDEEWLEGKEDNLDFEDERPAHKARPEIPESEQILKAQEQLAKIASAMIENPEEKASGFKDLAEIGQSKIPTVQMLALVTQMAVYKDVIPGYRIRSLLEESKGEQLSKEVRRLRQYELSLVTGYQNYIKELAKHARFGTKRVPGGETLASIATNCVTTLLNAVPHFNFRGDLLKIVVTKLARKKPDAEHVKCQQALSQLFRDDDEGRPTQEAVSMLAKMMKAKDWAVDESVLNLFLSLRLLTEFAGKASQDAVDAPETAGPPKRNKKEFRTKRERKSMKEKKALERDMTQADALVSHEERDKMQSETLKLVFATYFRILKARMPHLMGAVLEGLAKYAHLINQDFFGDLLEALKDLIRHSDNDADVESGDEEEEEDDDDTSVRNLSREGLLCTVTAFALLSGQDAHNSRTELHLDLSYFTTHLYKALLPLSTHPELENTSRATSSRESRINVQTTTVLLLRSISSVLLPSYNMRSVPPLRLAAFTKQIMTTALQLPDKSCQAALALLGDVTHTHGKKVASLWNTEERKGDGKFNALSDSVEGSNPFAATAWEGELLRKHFSPKVREGVKLLEKSITS